MKKYAVKWCLPLAAGIGLLAGIQVLAAGGGTTKQTGLPDEVETLLGQLNGNDWQVRRKAKEDLWRVVEKQKEALPAGAIVADQPVYQALVKRLCAMVAEQREVMELYAPRYLAVLLLGEMRAAEAVDVLLDNILFLPPLELSERTYQTVYPCVGALIKIGNPSVAGIIRRLDRETQPRVLRIYMVIVKSVPGGREHIQKELARIQLVGRNLVTIEQYTRE